MESQRSHRSSRGRSRSRSASPKRRRQEASPLVSPSDRGRPSKPRHDRKYSESPPSSPHSRDQRPSRRRSPSTSSSSRSRSSSRSAADHPRPVHRLPTATPIKDISIQNPVSKSRGSTVPNRRDPEVHRNGKTNGKRVSISSVLPFIGLNWPSCLACRGCNTFFCSGRLHGTPENTCSWSQISAP